MFWAGIFTVLVLLATLHTTTAQTASTVRAQLTRADDVPITRSAGAPVGGDLSLDNFEYQYGNTASLAGPPVTNTGLNKGQVAGIVIGCVLGGILFGSLAMLCWLKRKRLFPKKYGPCEHPGEAAPVSIIDVLRSGSKLDKMNKSELTNLNSFKPTTHAHQKPGNMV